MQGKIVLEEHFAISDTIGDSENFRLGGWDDLNRRLLDLDDERIGEMDENGIEFAIQSLNAPAIQAILSTDEAIEVSRKSNDVLAEAVGRHPTRYAGFAALPMQDPDAAAKELTRCVKDLGFIGALVNGYSQRDVEDSVLFYDGPEYRSFWSTVNELDVPFYLHPRAPIAARAQHFEGHPWFIAPAWGFAVETSIHALRIMASGLFDEMPNLKMIIGHMGERIPFDIWRIDHRIKKAPLGIPAKKPLRHYLQNNFYITTSGNFSDAPLQCAITEIGIDRMLFSVDYPFENTIDGTGWFDNANLSEEDRLQIGRTNAIELFNLDLK
jgi:2,3-dihydroxybenzoate decarboxylase